MFQLGGGLVLLGSVIGLYVVSADAGSPSYLYRRPAAARHLHQRGPLAVRRLLHRVRGQGAAVPGAHLAGRHHRAGDAADERAAGLRARQDRHLRDAAVLPRPVPGGLRLGDAAGRGAGADLDRLRRVRGHRPGRHPAADRPDLAEPLRLHHPGHLRVHHAGRQRLDPLHGQPRHRDRRAVPDRRLRDQAARHHADQPDGRPREGHPGRGRAVPGRRAGHRRPAGAEPVRLRDPGADLGLRLPLVRRRDRRHRHRPGRGLHALGLPEDVDRPEPRRPAGRRRRRWATRWPTSAAARSAYWRR